MSKIIGVTVGTAMAPSTIKEKLHPVTSVNGQSPDENGNVEIEAGGASSWNDLTDKPFGEDSGGWISFAKHTHTVTHISFTEEKTWNATFSHPTPFTEGKRYKIVAKSNVYGMPQEVTGEYVCTYRTISGLMHYYDLGDYIGQTDNPVAMYTAGSINVQFEYSVNFVASHTWEIEIFEQATVVNPLDEKYIPDTIARVSDIPEVPTNVSQLTNDAGYITAADLPDNPGGGGTGSPAIVDVTELPTEGISESAFYRLQTGTFVYNQYLHDQWNCHCVNGLPETGEPAVTGDLGDMDSWIITAYYNMNDSTVSSYVTDDLAGVFGVPAGWYPVGALMDGVGESFSGIIADINDDPQDDTWRLLLSKDYYIYQDGWCKVPFAYERPPKFDITWDGDMTGRTVIDMSLLGFDAGTYFVKVSDEVLTESDVVGGSYEYYDNEDDSYYPSEIVQSDLDFETYPGSFTINNWISIVQDEETLTSALGVPAGHITNGVYYLLHENVHRLVRLTTRARITKIDTKFVDTYSKSEVDDLIYNAIGYAIGGSY